MPKVTQLPILTTATTQTYFIVVDNSISKRYNYNSFSLASMGYTGSAGATGAISRTTVTTSTAVVMNGATVSLNVPIFKSYALSKITTNAPAEIRIYTDAASRTSDSSRIFGNQPVGSGLVTEIATTATALTKVVAPAILGFNNDVSVNTTSYVTVKNNSGISRSIEVTFTVLQLES